MKTKHLISVFITITMLLSPIKAFCEWIWMYKCKLLQNEIKQNNCGPDCTGTCVYIKITDMNLTGGECVPANFYNFCKTTDPFYIGYQVQLRRCVMIGEYPSTRCIPGELIQILEDHQDQDAFLAKCK